MGTCTCSWDNSLHLCARGAHRHDIRRHCLGEGGSRREPPPVGSLGLQAARGPKEQSAGLCCNFCDNPGNGVDKPWWRPGANAKCDRDDLACAGCSECKTKHCRQREGHDQSAGSCCNFCALGRRGNKKKAPHNPSANWQQKGAALYEYKV